MKVAGILVLVLGLAIGFLYAMIPVSVEVFGAENDASCGPPLLRVISQQEDPDPNGQRLIDLCEDVSADRLPYAALAVGLGVVVGGGLLVVASRREGDQPAPPPVPPPAGPPPA